MEVGEEESLAKRYTSKLSALKINSKHIINSLTRKAEDKIKYAHVVVRTIKKQLVTVQPSMKLPILYLIDSIVKNVKKRKKVYLTLFKQNIVSDFVSVFEQVDDTTRSKMFKLRRTWNRVFSSKELDSIDSQVHQIDPIWPIMTKEGEQFLLKKKKLIQLQQKKIELELKKNAKAKAKLEERNRKRKLQLQEEANKQKHQQNMSSSLSNNSNATIQNGPNSSAAVVTQSTSTSITSGNGNGNANQWLLNQVNYFPPITQQLITTKYQTFHQPLALAQAHAHTKFKGPPPGQPLINTITPYCDSVSPPALAAINCIIKPEAICPSPPGWESSYKKALGSTTPYILIPVDNNSKEYSVLASLVSSVKNVTKIERVVNAQLWKRFVNTRRDILSSKSNDADLLRNLKLDDLDMNMDWEESANVAKKFKIDPSVAGAAEYSDNFVLLFHGTRHSLQEIFEQGLDERLSGSTKIGTGLLGKGIYFSDDPLKSMYYDRHGVLLIFAVLLGDCMDVDHLPDKRTFAREPKKATHQKRKPSDMFFDSIAGRPNPANEFVIYNRNQCCPLYAVTYTYTRGGQGQGQLQERKTYLNTLPSFLWTQKKKLNENVNISIPNASQFQSWPFFAKTIFELMKKKNPTTEMTLNEDCLICCSEFPPNPINSVVLKCQHKICKTCHGKLCHRGVTMSGVEHVSIKCPFCQAADGIEIGTCPKGEMKILKRGPYPKRHCEGYEQYGVIVIVYIINQRKYQTNRAAYLPDSPEGNKVLELLKVAWDRRLCFTIGTSATTGKSDTVVWRIHHKTNLNGGSANYGYPDPTYLQRVSEELKQVGIE